jgi:glutamyl-Q tRNA(Asp) synthetase
VCSRREIADSAIAGTEGPVYPGTCRGGIVGGRGARALRLDTSGAAVAFEDALQGQITCNLERESGDFVLYRSDGVYAYQLAVVVDDAEQGITDVVRGADLLASTPRQIYIQRILGLPQPRYAHLPVAVNARGEKLSKQTLALPVDAAQPLPALMAALSFLGQRPPRGLERATVRELWAWAIENWKLVRVPRIATAPAP